MLESLFRTWFFFSKEFWECCYDSDDDDDTGVCVKRVSLLCK